ncbi:MAG: hypothetical protein R2710_20435 [Acidimicrobiales bacterium]
MYSPAVAVKEPAEDAIEPRRPSGDVDHDGAHRDRRRTSPAGAGPAHSASERLPGVLIVDDLGGHADSNFHGDGVIEIAALGDDHLEGTAGLQLAESASVITPAGGFSICHDGSVPQAVLNDVRAALTTWSAALRLSGPTIAIDLGWISLAGDGTLGVAGPTEFVVDPRLPLPDLGYPMALANQLLGHDVNGTGCGDARSEIALFLNSTAGGDGSLWNIGDDDASDTQVDLSTVVLHEVGHGLGVVSSARLVNDVVEWPKANSPSYVYDHFFGECRHETSAGCDSDLAALSSATSNSLRSAQLWFRSAGGQALELHAPLDWSGGFGVASRRGALSDVVGFQPDDAVPPSG